jgi:hypothetical protein
MGRAAARALYAGLSVLACSCVIGVAHAQQIFEVAPPAPTPPETTGTEKATVSQYWELGRPRWFMATTMDAGFAYLRPRFSLGYGQPYWRFAQLDAQPIVTTAGAGQYLGFLGTLKFTALRLGARYYYPFSRSFLLPRDRYSRRDIQLVEGPRADYLALEAELSATVPVYVGSLFALATMYRTSLVPDGYYLFEESLHTVMKPPYIWRGRLGYLVGLGSEGGIRVGVATDVIGLPGRDEFVVRAGVLGNVLINAHLEAQASFIPVIVSPDTIGLAGADFGQLGVRFRWATDSEPDPERQEAADRKAAGEAAE